MVISIFVLSAIDPTRLDYVLQSMMSVLKPGKDASFMFGSNLRGLFYRRAYPLSRLRFVRYDSAEVLVASFFAYAPLFLGPKGSAPTLLSCFLPILLVADVLSASGSSASAIAKLARITTAEATALVPISSPQVFCD
jgi:hypothetical protein